MTKFKFHNKVYLYQINLVMDSPLGQTLSNIFMGFISRKVIPNYKVTYFRFVDDCFVLGKNEKEIDELFSVFNKTHSLITFS